MPGYSFIVTVAAIGFVTGAVAGQVMKQRGLGILGCIIVGMVGAIAGGWLLDRLQVWPEGGLPGALLQSLVGAIVLLGLIGAVRKARSALRS